MAESKILKTSFVKFITSGENIDNAKEAGIYFVDGANSYTRYGVLLVAENIDGKAYQIWMQNDGASLKIRYWNKTTWGAWNSLHN